MRVDGQAMSFKKYWIFITLFAFSFPLLDFITLHRKCDWLGDGGPEYYGFPFVYRTGIPWVNSMSGEFYGLGYLGNVLFYLLLSVWIIRLLKIAVIHPKLKSFLSKASKATIILLVILTIFSSFIVDWNFQWTDGRNKFEKAARKELKCDCKIELFSTSK
jgi:small-conductance mechanosensitive channel